jgi:hypothetical protein
MKKKFVFFGIIAVFLTCVFGIAVTKYYSLSVTDFNSSDVSYKALGGLTSDTINTSDTIIQIVQIQHADDINLFGQIYYDKIKVGINTLTLYALQSNDGVNYVSVKKGVAPGTVWSKAYATIGSDTSMFFSFALDSARFEGRYLKLLYKTGAIANTTARLTTFLKINRK